MKRLVIDSPVDIGQFLHPADLNAPHWVVYLIWQDTGGKITLRPVLFHNQIAPEIRVNEVLAGGSASLWMYPGFPSCMKTEGSTYSITGVGWADGDLESSQCCNLSLRFPSENKPARYTGRMGLYGSFLIWWLHLKLMDSIVLLKFPSL